MNKKEKQIDWNRVYKEGSQLWEPKDGPSKSVQEFIRYLKEGDKILDLGCGSGRDSIFLAKQGYDVWGIDISKEAIKKAKENFQAKNLHFLVANAENLPFEDEFFDAIYSRWVLQFVPLKKAASEIFRVLKNNGIAFIAFLLNTKIIATRELTEFHRKEDIISTYENFKILKQVEFKIEELDAKKPHMHDALIIILKKR